MPPAPWPALTRIGFRFCFIYFGLFGLLFAQITFVYAGIVAHLLPDHAVLWQQLALDPVTRWTGHTVFGIDAPLHPDSGSGDQAAIWMLVFDLLTVSVLGSAVWSYLDRRRTEYRRLSAWFLVFLRLCVGGQMLFYGFAKLFPTQMPTPPLRALLEPFGEFSPAAVLWLQVGSSHPYEMALGAVEVTAGALLYVQRTATLGALLSLLSMGQVFLLNMTFDVPVKVLSFHLLAMSALLLVPQSRRLADVLVLARPAPPAVQPELFDSARANRLAAVVQVALGAFALAGCALTGWQAWHEHGGGRPKPRWYGIWSVTDFTAGGRTVAPLTTDRTRWQRVVFDQDGALTYQRMDGTLVDAKAHADDHVITLTDPVATFAVEQPGAGRLLLHGQLDGQPVTMSLQQQNLNDFTLRNRGFHWVQEYPYFR
ncbi:MAG: DoxX family protein [Mycobacterium sp.]|nr:DoxX family protein [Mycobacterium sp.]